MGHPARPSSWRVQLGDLVDDEPAGNLLGLRLAGEADEAGFGDFGAGIPSSKSIVDVPSSPSLASIWRKGRLCLGGRMP